MGHKRKIRQSDKDFADLVQAESTGMTLHVRIGSQPAWYATVLRKRRLPKVGDRLLLKNPLEGGEPLRVRCWRIVNVAGEPLYFMEL